MPAKQTATQNYQARQQEIADLLARVKSALAKHATRAAAQPDSWAFSGDLAPVASSLVDLLFMLGALTSDERVQYKL